MRPLIQILSGALFTLCLSIGGVAAADPDSEVQPLDSAVFQTVTDMQLDTAFERFVSEGSDRSLPGLSGPSSMDCTDKTIKDGIETCVVTTRAPSNSIPAALAQH